MLCWLIIPENMTPLILTLPNSTSNITTLEELSLTASKIALDNFEWQYVTLVFFNSTALCCVDVFLQSYKKSTIVGKGTFYPNFAQITRQYVLFGRSVADVTDTIKWMESHVFDNTGKYIIVCQSQDCEENDAITFFWDHKITNVIFLRSFQDEIIGYTYFPLSDSHCTSNKPMKLDLKSCVSKTGAQNCNDIFPAKLKNLNRCRVIGSTFIQLPYMESVNGTPRGADGDLMRLIAEGLNASLAVMTPRLGFGWGRLEENGSWSGSLADVYYGHADFSMTSAAVTLSRYTYFHLSKVYNTASVVWVTHPPKLMPSSLKLMHPFQFNAQVVLAISFILIVICAMLVRSKLWITQCRRIKDSTPRGSIVFYSWMIFMGLGLPSTKMPAKTAFLYIILLWIWFGVLMRTFYQVSLMTVLKANYYYSEFQTIDDSIEEGYPFGGGAALKYYYIDYPPVLDNWIDIKAENIIPTMRLVSKGKEFTLAMNMESAKSVIWREKINIHILHEKVIVSPTVIMFNKFSPLVEPVDRILFRLIESGFSSKSYKDYVFKRVVHKDDDTLDPINLEHYTGCYAVLIAGCILSFLLCLAEIIYVKLNIAVIIETLQRPLH